MLSGKTFTLRLKAIGCKSASKSCVLASTLLMASNITKKLAQHNIPISVVKHARDLGVGLTANKKSVLLLYLNPVLLNGSIERID